MIQHITDSNFLRTAMRYYDNSQCMSIAEFEEDVKRFAYLKKLFGRYRDNGDLKERLIINHLIILHNVFGSATTHLLFFKIDRDYWNTLGTFLIFLNRMPPEIPEFGITLSDIIIDATIMDALQDL